MTISNTATSNLYCSESLMNIQTRFATPKPTDSTQDFAKDKSQAVKEVLGYGVDSEGFFTNDFNAAAGIPNNYKIFADDAKSFVDFHQKRSDILATHNKIDIAKSIGNAYKIFSQLIPQNSNANFSNEELAKIPYAFIVDRNHNVKQTYNYEEYAKLDSIQTGNGEWIYQSFNTWNVGNGFSEINTDTIFNTYSNYTININKSAYQNANGSISAGGV